MTKLSHLSRQRQQILQERAERERLELQPRNHKPPEPAAAGASVPEEEAALPGRTTGSLAWRAARGEIGNGDMAGAEAAAAGGGKEGCGVHAAGLTKSVLYGGCHADSVLFDDAAQVDAYRGQQLRVKAVTVWAGDGDNALVFGVQLHYERKEGGKYTSFDGPPHLANQNSPPAPRRIKLKEGERITCVSGRAGAVVDRLEFIIQTCTGDMCSERVEAFGGNGGAPFFCPVPQGQELVGLAGALGGHLHSISVYTVQPEAGAAAKSGCGTTITASSTASPAASGGQNSADAEKDKQRLQQLIRHFFFEIQREGGGGDANTAAAQAVERARAWIAENGNSAPLPSSS